MSRSGKPKLLPSTPSRAGAAGAGYAALGVILVAAAALRVWAALDAFWLDEIWSLSMYAGGAKSPWDILAHMRESNNHHLVTLWMYACGSQEHWIVYRLPSVAAGLGTVALAWHIARQWGDNAALGAALLTGSSFLLVTYASEARGYAPAGFFALLALVALQCHLKSGGWPSAVAYAAAVLLGFLSHLTFLFFALGAGAWSIAEIRQRAWPWQRSAVALLKCQGLAAVLSVGFYFVCVRGYVVSAADDYQFLPTVLRTLSLAMGGWPRSTAAAGALATIAIVVLGAGLWRLWREGNTLWVLFATTIVLGPAALLLVQPSALFERFFYVSMLFLLLLAAYVFDRAARHSTAGWAAAWLTISLVVLGNSILNWEFLRVGRGQYLAALEFIFERTSASAVHLGSDNDFRNGMVLQYYLPRLQDARGVQYYAEPRSFEGEWMLVHGFGPNYKARPGFVAPEGRRFRLIRVFPYYGLSGFHWAVYRRQADAGPPLKN